MKALCGCDYIRDGEGTPIDKNLAGWKVWADREAKRHSKRDGVLWHASVAYIIWRDAYRVSFGAQPYNILTGN